MSNNILASIVAHKREELAQTKKERPLAAIKELAQESSASRGFAQTIHTALGQNRTAVIAEIKKASPSKGVLCEHFDPLGLARAYAGGGAVCLSVLTDRKYFQGSGVMLDLVRRHCPLPALRKDFIVDAYQVYESRAYGADCILLIAAILEQEQLQLLSQLAREQGMDTLLEVHNEAELEKALSLGEQLQLLGINNRNLEDFTVDLETTLRLAAMIPAGQRQAITVVSESGIAQRADLHRLAQAGVKAALVGESLVTADNPQAQLQLLLSENSGR